MDPDADLSPDRYAAPISGGRGGPPWPASGRRFRTRRHLIARIIFERAHRRRRSGPPDPPPRGLTVQASVLGRCAGRRTPAHRPPGPLAALTLHLAPGSPPCRPRPARVRSRAANLSAVAHRLRRSDLPAPPRGAGVRTRGSGSSAGRRTPAHRPPGPFRCAALSTWPPAPRRAFHDRLAFRPGPQGVPSRRTAPGVPLASIPVLRPRCAGSGLRGGGRSPAASRGGRTRGLTRRSPGRQVRSLRSLSTWPPGSTPCRSAGFAASRGDDVPRRGRGPCGPREVVCFSPSDRLRRGSQAAGRKGKNMPSAVAIE